MNTIWAAVTGVTSATIPAASAGEEGLYRYGVTDELTCSYRGNQLTRVDDAVSTNGLPRAAGYQGAPASLAGDFQEEGVRQAQEYRYDANGNQTHDANKRITAIAYNHLNLPKRIVFGTDSLVFRYTASGQKVQKRVYQTGKALVQTDYLGAYQYEGDSLRFFPHAEGRVLHTVQVDAAGQAQVRYEREYSLKDHLGNLRIAYRPGQRVTYRATMEVEPASRARQEEQQWDSGRVAATRTATGLARSQQYAAKLNAAAGQPLGPVKLLAVHQGDTVRFTAPGLYQQPVRNPRFGFSLLGFVASLLQQPAPVSTLGPDGRSRLRALPFLGLGLGLVPALTPRGRVPKGYARVLVYNADSVLVDSRTQQLSEQALNRYEELAVQVIAPEAGYVTCYVGNESDVDVYFDDVQLDYGPALLVQENHYDPWGLNLAGIEKTGGLPLNQYQYNGKEKQTDLGLGWNDYGARMYSPQLGRFSVTDRFSEKYYPSSPYSYGGNNPISIVDINGDSLWIIHNNNRVLYENGSLYSVNASGRSQYRGSHAKIDKNGNVTGYKGFLNQAFKALNTITNSDNGSNGDLDFVIENLQASNFNFSIQDAASNNGRNEFVGDDLDGEYSTARINAGHTRSFSLGSGGRIFWNPNGSDAKNGVSELGGGVGIRPTSNLFHEMFHAYEAGLGVSTNRDLNGLKYNEWRASYYENILRGYLNYPLRSLYNLKNGSSVNILDSYNRPIYVPQVVPNMPFSQPDKNTI